jgi:ParB/RepB/Spo0J family partition protein
MSDIVMVPLARLRPDPHQARRTFQRIAELAESIATYGLLENLVVREADSSGLYEIKAGERRFRALRLLKEQGRLKNDEVPCFVVRTDGVYESLIENVQREDVALWELGRKYNYLCESGLAQTMIASRIGKTPGHVSTAVTLARGLAPAVVVRLSTLPPNTFPIQRLLRLAALVDDAGEPDEPNQLRLFEQMLGTPTRKAGRPARKRTERETVWARYRRLKEGARGLRVDPVYEPFLSQVLKYLAGETTGLTK